MEDIELGINIVSSLCIGPISFDFYMLSRDIDTLIHYILSRSFCQCFQ